MDEDLHRALMAALVLQHGWGADEALADVPQDRRSADRSPPAPTPAREAAGARPDAAPPRAAAAPTPAPAAPALGGGAVARAEALAAAAGDLAALREAVAGFDGLALRETATNLVFADGDPTAPLMIIGEAPGAEEDREGRPFVGASGRLLDRMLASIDLARTASGAGSFYITNIVVWRPPGNRNPTDSEIALSLPFIRRHVALVRPRLILLLGAVAVRSLTGAREGITRLRGKWFDVQMEGPETVPALATLHPAYLLRNPGAKKDAWADLLALQQRLGQIRQH